MALIAPRTVSRCRLVRFAAHEGGGVGILFGVALLPLGFLVGAAMDYSGASNLRVLLQKATDGTNLKLCQMPVTTTQSALDQAAAKLMASYMNTANFTVDPVKAKSNPRQIELSTNANFATGLIKAFGYPQIPVAANASCTLGEPQTYEIALVLDTTGSMNTAHNGTSKIQSLRQAATEFVNYVYDDPKMSVGAKVSIVPFSASVAVDPATSRNASWMDTNGQASYHWSGIKGGLASVAPLASFGVKNRFSAFDQLKSKHASWDWKGCVEARPYPFNVQDAAPSPSSPNSYYVPMWAIDESGEGGMIHHKDGSKDVISYNSYIDDGGASGCSSATDEATKTGQICKYMDPQNPKTIATWGGTKLSVGPNRMCDSRPLTRMTTSRANLLSEIGSLNAEGNTNIHQGLTWGWQTISPDGVFKSDAEKYGKKNNNKVIVLMTDGMNTWGVNANNVLGSIYSAYGFLKNPDGSNANVRLPAANANPANDAQLRAAMDAMTVEGCKNAAAAPNNVVIYTIGFSVPNDPIDQQGLDMLKACAGSSSRSFVAGSGTDLVSIFKMIGQDIGGLRLTN